MQTRSGERAGELLPRIVLRRARDGENVDVRRGRGPLILFVTHGAECRSCHDYIHGVLTRESDAAVWGARLHAVIPGPLPGDRRGMDAEVLDAMLIDEKREMADGNARVIVADEWGEIFWTSPVGDEHAFPQVDDVMEWVRFVAIQCPECEGPEGEWRMTP